MEIKVETLTQYGVVHGTVQSVSNDAIEDEKLGLVYSTRIQLKERPSKSAARKSPCRRAWR